MLGHFYESKYIRCYDPTFTRSTSNGGSQRFQSRKPVEADWDRDGRSTDISASQKGSKTVSLILHSCVQFFEILTSKSVADSIAISTCLTSQHQNSSPDRHLLHDFDLQRCFAPQLRSIFAQGFRQRPLHPPLCWAFQPLSTIPEHKSIETHSISSRS